MRVDANEKLPTGQMVGLLASFIFIMFPPYILFREGPIFLFGDSPLVYLHVYSAIGGAICGIAYGNQMKIAGLISGVASALGGTAFFSYYAFYPPVKDVIHTSELLLTLGVGSAPGIALYFLLKKIKNRSAQQQDKAI
jgi:hypothetical protein